MDFYKGKKILITGGAGFVGSHLVKALLHAGAEVFIIDNFSRGHIDNLKDDLGRMLLAPERIIEGDLKDAAFCDRTIVGFDLVFHLADLVGGIQYVFNNECYIFSQNIIINTNTLTACIRNSIPDYIYIGTACSYPKELQSSYTVSALHEDQTYPANPESSYGWSKLIGEYEAELAHSKGQINVGILRAHNIYGPHCMFDAKTSQVIPSLIRKAINYPQERYVVWGSGNQYRDFVYIDDVIEAFLLLAQHGMGKGVIQIGSGEACSIAQAATIIKEISGKDLTIEFEASANEGDKGRVAIVEKAERILGWKPKTVVRDGITKTYRWIESNIHS